jgi:hypothetical protein
MKRRRKTIYCGVYTPSGNRVAKVGAPTYEAAIRKAKKRHGLWYRFA